MQKKAQDEERERKRERVRLAREARLVVEDLCVRDINFATFFIRFCYSCDIKFVFNYYLREKAEREAAEREKQQVEESDDGVVVSKVRYLESSPLPSAS